MSFLPRVNIAGKNINILSIVVPAIIFILVFAVVGAMIPVQYQEQDTGFVSDPDSQVGVTWSAVGAYKDADGNTYTESMFSRQAIMGGEVEVASFDFAFTWVASGGQIDWDTFGLDITTECSVGVGNLSTANWNTYTFAPEQSIEATGSFTRNFILENELFRWVSSSDLSQGDGIHFSFKAQIDASADDMYGVLREASLLISTDVMSFGWGEPYLDINEGDGEGGSTGGGDYYCSDCDMYFSTYLEYLTHVLAVHGDTGVMSSMGVSSSVRQGQLINIIIFTVIGFIGSTMAAVLMLRRKHK